MFPFFGFSQSTDTTILLQSLVIQFESDDHSISEPYRDQIDILLQKSDTLNGVHAEIEAHTDDVGQADYNLKLSQMRAEAIRTYLVDHGLDDQIVQIDYYGERQLLDDSFNEKGRALNRRAVLRLYYTKDNKLPESNSGIRKRRN